AIKGAGGFELVCDARRAEVVAKLRRRKHSPHAPLPVLFGDERQLAGAARVTPAELAALRSPAAPIVLVEKRDDAPLAEVAPDCAWLGAMLPGSPLHQLLADALAAPLVCTGGNMAGEPRCSDDGDSCARLGALAD